jgi:rRNA maturation endonuclease Nob1
MSILEAAPSLNLHSDFSFSNIKPDIISKEIEVSDKINFLLCESCFWCASYFNNYRKVVTNCPICGSKNIESMPISHDEVNTSSHDPKRGVTLGFSKWRSQLA